MSKVIAKALYNVMSKVSYVQKSQTNEFHRYNYAGEADLLAVLRPAMLEEGLILIPSVDEIGAIDDFGNTTIKVGYTLVHKDGDVWPHTIYAGGCGNDRAKSGMVGDKGLYKAITGANKYLLFKLFQIETGDDPEQNSNEMNAPEKVSVKEVLARPLKAPETITELATQAVDGPTKESVDPDTILSTPITEAGWQSTATIVKTYVEVHPWPDIKQLWTNNQDTMQAMKKHDEDLYTSCYVAVMAKKPGRKAAPTGE